MLATTRPSGAARTAASSPIPTSVRGSGGSHPDNAAIRPNSPSAATVSCSAAMVPPVCVNGLHHYGSVIHQGHLSLKGPGRTSW